MGGTLEEILSLLKIVGCAVIQLLTTIGTMHHAGEQACFTCLGSALAILTQHLNLLKYILWNDYLMVLCNSQREEGLVPSQICRTSNRVIPQNYKINLEPIFNFLRLFYWIIVEKTSMSRSAEKTFFTSAQVAQKLFFIMLLLDKLARSCTLGNAQNERVAIIER